MISGTTEKLFSSFRRGTLFVGFSGGADSTAALLCSLDFRERHPVCRVEAVHFDHHLRGAESAREASEAQRFAEARNVPFRKIDLAVADSGEGIEAAAREARLAEWVKLAGNRGDAAVVLGHHADDRVETLLMRLFRGSNASALAAMRARSTLHGVTFLRPLLKLDRGEIEEFLRSRGVETWQNDSSNRGTDYDRNFWRNELLPAIYAKFPWSRPGVRKALDALEEDAKFIEDAAKNYYDSGDPASQRFWRAAAPALRHRLLRRFIAENTGKDLVPSAATLARFEELLNLPDDGAARELPVSGGVALYLQDGKLAVAAPPPAGITWDWRHTAEVQWGPWCLERRFERDVRASGTEKVCFDAALLPETLLVGAPRPTERMVPFGRTTAELLHKLRTDRHVRSRTSPPVLRDESGTVWWAPLVRRSALAPVGDDTTEAVCFCCRARKDPPDGK